MNPPPFLQEVAKKLRAWTFRRNRARVFTKIYERRLWGDSSSVSGTGSNLQATEAIRQKLPELFASLGVESVIDIPCGDFLWMRLVVEQTGVRYQGFDIVPELIAENQRRYGNANVRFDVLDIVKDAPPAADLSLCRHLLIHLPLKDAQACIRNFRRGGSKYLLVTNQPDCASNEEIVWTGAYRPLNLALPPFGLTPITSIPDAQSEADKAELALYRLDQNIDSPEPGS